MPFNLTKLGKAMQDLAQWTRDGLSKKADAQTTATEIDKGVSTQNSKSFSFSGNGRAQKLTGGVILNPRAGNRLILEDNGLGVYDEAPPDVAEQFVDSTAGNDGNVGSRAAPLRTIAAALIRIRDSGGAGSYAIRLKAGRTFILDGQLAAVDNAQIALVAYDDVKYLDGSDSTAGPSYYWWAAPDYNRPVLDFRLFPDAKFPQYSIFPLLYCKSLTLTGLTINFPAGPATFPGFAWYPFSTENSNGRVWSQGCNLNYRGTHLMALARCSQLWAQCMVMSNFTNGARLGTNVLSYNVADDNAYDVDFVALDSKYPTFHGRMSNLRALLQPGNLDAGSSWNSATKTFFGTNINYDIFA